MFLFLTIGLMIFSSFFVFLKYMWQSIWRSEVYFMLGYLLLFTALTLILVAELGIIVTYLHLKNGDYRW